MNHVREYAKFLGGFIDAPGKVRVLFDSSNGSTGPVLRELFSGSSGIEAVFVNDRPDGSFPAHGPNPLIKEAMDEAGKEVVKNRADMGVIFDGDGDRVFFLDERGDPLDAYESFSCIKRFLSPPYVLDVRALADFTMPDQEIVRTKVGYYFIRKAMRERGAELGAEYSGHFYFKNFFFADSGILAAVYMINYLSWLKGEGKSLSRSRETRNFVTLPETNFEVDFPGEAIEKIKEHFAEEKGAKIDELDGLTVKTDKFAFNVRESATEPLLRFTLAAKEEKTLGMILEKVKTLLGKNA